jgi:hypothetical protein
MSLIETFDKLTSGKPVYTIVGVSSETTARTGMKVAFAEDNENADAWICHDETGFWLTGNAHESRPTGYHGFKGFEEPLSAIKEVVLLDASAV